jgi:hypothetical protein
MGSSPAPLCAQHTNPRDSPTSYAQARRKKEKPSVTPTETHVTNHQTLRAPHAPAACTTIRTTEKTDMVVV